MSRRSERRAEQERRELAQRELLALYNRLHRAYAVFDETADPALAEAAVLEIGALQQRFGLGLRNLKRMEQAADAVSPQRLRSAPAAPPA